MAEWKKRGFRRLFLNDDDQLLQHQPRPRAGSLWPAMIRERIPYAKKSFHPQITKFAALLNLLLNALYFAGQLSLCETVLIPI